MATASSYDDPASSGAVYNYMEGGMAVMLLATWPDRWRGASHLHAARRANGSAQKLIDDNRV